MSDPSIFQGKFQDNSNSYSMEEDFSQVIMDSEPNYNQNEASSTEYNKISSIFLGPKSKKYVLVLDLDNTLVSTIPVYEMGVNNGKPVVRYEIRVRPYAQELLEKASELFEVIVFTAGQEEYAQVAVNLLDSQRIYIKRVLSRSYCTLSMEGPIIKDLSIIKDREIKNIVIVDDSPACYSLQPNNGIPVTPYIGQEDDEELRYLADYLEDLASADDIIPYNQMRIHATSDKAN